MIRPKRPNTELKISMTRILTKLRRSTSVLFIAHGNRLVRNIQCRIRSIGQRSAATVDADSNTADEITHADGQARPE